MNVYCQICTKEMEIIEDYGTELRVHPCGCANDNAALRARIAELEGEREKVDTAYREYVEAEKNPEIYGLGERMRAWDALTTSLDRGTG